LQRLIARVDLFFATARRSGLPDSLEETIHERVDTVSIVYP